MQFQKALCLAMDERQVTQEELAARTDASLRWIIEITTNPEWHPKLDTILRLCHALRFDVIKFLDIAEVGSRGLTPNSKQRVFSLEEQMVLLLDVMPSHVAMALRSLRLEKGLSQRKLEKLTPFSVNTISMREGHRNKNYPTVTTLLLYCEAFSITLAEFVMRVFYHAQEDQHHLDSSVWLENLFQQIL